MTPQNRTDDQAERERIQRKQGVHHMPPRPEDWPAARRHRPQLRQGDQAVTTAVASKARPFPVIASEAKQSSVWHRAGLLRCARNDEILKP